MGNNLFADANRHRTALRRVDVYNCLLSVNKKGKKNPGSITRPGTVCYLDQSA